MLMPPISRYMTHAPAVVEPTVTMTAAHRVMHSQQIRHLPVLRDQRLVGMVTDRDLYQYAGVEHFDPDRVTVEEVMIREVEVVPPQAGLQDVAELMAEKKCGSVVVVDHDRVVGIFTTTDALRALTDIMGREA